MRFILIILAIAGLWYLGQPSAESKAWGEHCMNGWTGSHLKLEEAVKKSLRDPKSFEHVETRTSKVKDGVNKVRMEFRAKNGFGGLNTGYAYAEIDNKTCKLLSWRLKE